MAMEVLGQAQLKFDHKFLTLKTGNADLIKNRPVVLQLPLGKAQ